MVESSACREWQSLIVRLCGRITHRASLSVSPQSDKRLTQDEFSKALHLTEHTLQYYRQTDIVPHTAIGNNISFRRRTSTVFSPITLFPHDDIAP